MRFLAALLVTLATAAGLLVATAGEGQAVSALCHGKASGAPFKFGPVSKSCSYTSPNNPKWKGQLVIQWQVQGGTNQTGCVFGRMSKARNPDSWQGLGCGQSGQATVKWPRNTASMLEIKVKSNTIAFVNIDYYIP